MKTEKIDKRVIKTKTQIYTGLLKLLENKSFADIKVSEICKTAKVNRTTFYAHFNNKQDLFNGFMNDMQKELIHQLKSIKQSSFKSYYMQIASTLLDHIDNKKTVYITIIKHNRYDIILDILQKNIKEALIKEEENKSSVPQSFITTFYLGGIINIGIEWILSHSEVSKEDVKNHLDSLIPTRPKI